MSDFFLGEIRMFGFAYAPQDWALADGTVLPINQNQPLFALLRNMYGGDGARTFALPDLRGRTPVGCIRGAPVGSAYQQGHAAGVETVTLTDVEMPLHTHALLANTLVGTTGNATDGFISTVALDDLPAKNQRTLYAEATGGALVNLAADSIQHAGGGQAHTNMQPFAVLNVCIALRGIYPPHP